MELGAHVSSSGGIDTAIDRIEAMGGDCVQVFTQSPRMWRPTNHKPEAIERFKARCAGDTWLLMENSAGTGGTIGRSLDELTALLERLDRHPRLGICLDSCHLFASGYDVTDAGVVDALVDEVDETIGLDRLRALHVNDSATPLGSNRDRHANIGEGVMGDGLGAFLAHPAFQHLPAYLEVPGVDKKGPNADELRKLRALHERATRPRRRRAATRGK